MISCPLPMNLQKPNAFLLYKTCIFELKPYFFFIVTIVTIQKDAHTVYLPFKNDFILVLYNKIN